MTKKRLRLGLLLEGYVVPAWLYVSIQQTLDSGCVELVLVVESREHRPASFGGRLWRQRGRAVQLVHERVDRKLFSVHPDAFAGRDLRDLVGEVDTVDVDPGDLSAEALELIRGYQLDILVKAGSGPLRGPVLALPRLGVWAYDHHETDGYWETVKALPYTESALKRLGDQEQEERILYRSWALTDRVSISRNRSACHWTAATFLPRQIKLLHRLGEEEFFEAVREYERAELRPLTQPFAPGNRDGAVLALHHFARLSRTMGERLLFIAQWFLLYGFTDEFPESLRGLRALIPPKDRFWADPHVVARDGRFYIFVEELLFESNHGHISVIEIREDGTASDPVRVLERDYHLSYPFVFEVDDTYYMIPETMENRTIEIYECVDFPHEWRLKMNLMEEVAAVDSTVYFRDGLWWLFVGMTEHEGAGTCEELCVFYSSELLSGSWEPHPLNPVVSDVRSARPAGALFERDGKLFRPSQDSSGTYGAAIVLNEVSVLSKTAYHETEVGRLLPDWIEEPGATHATHTVNTAPGFVVVDAKATRSKYF